MNVLFEEDGAFKAGSILTGTDSALQVELVSGKRTKVKSSHVLLQFREPSPAALLERAHAESETIDLDFLWEAAPQEEFDFRDLARDYYGREPLSAEAAALLLRLHSAPVYFYRKGRGRYRPAPPETLKAALLAVERKRRQEEARQSYVDQLVAGRVPALIAAQAIGLVVQPDRATIEFKALEQAAAVRQTTPLRLLLDAGAITSPYRWHVDSFLFEHFRMGTAFPAHLQPTDIARLDPAASPAFSIDDSATTEIDDAFSVTTLAEGRVRVGIHIAAPALAIEPGGPIDLLARARMSTVYAPGIKITMLPDDWIDAFSLQQGRALPALSLYVDVDSETLDVVGHSTRVERVEIAANLRHDQLDAMATDDAMTSGSVDTPFGHELGFLWRFAHRLLEQREAVRGRPEPIGRIDYSFGLDGEGESARVHVVQRRRGSPLDLIVAELMILANSTWGRELAANRIAGIYRSQQMGKVRMSTTPAAHDGIGVTHYAWSTSPLRRYVDLVNQRQLIALARAATPTYAANDADLFAIVSSFDAAYSAYAEFQEKMERYWALRWIAQESKERIEAVVLRGDVIRLAGLPFVTRLPGLGDSPRGQRLDLAVLGTDLVDLRLEARVNRVLDVEPAESLDDALDEPVDDAVESIAESAMSENPIPVVESVPAPEGPESSL